MNISKTFITITILTSLSACASITSNSVQPVTINSNPQGAKASVGGNTVTTPAVVDLKGKSAYFVTASKDGYITGNNVIESEVRFLPAVIGNIFNLTGVIGMAVDFFGTGAAYKLDNEVTVNLDKK